VKIMSDWSLFLHTGEGTILWSIVLFLVCVALLFFIYSGFAMTLKRIKNTGIPKNKFTKDNSEVIILVGSETGSTFSFVSLFYEALIAQGKSVFISEMNKYTTYQEAKQLLIFTSTYGEGNAPINANTFEYLVETIYQNQTINYAVVGFGSLLYPDYCKYAVDVDRLLKVNQSFNQSLELFKINNQSFEAFQTWVNQWSVSNNIQLQMKQPVVKLNSKYSREFKVVKRTDLNCDETFMLQLQPTKKVKFQSGDLLAFRPDVNEAFRYYSVAKMEDDVLLSIKKHEKGLCSSYLSALKVDDIVSATVEHNKAFHIPKLAKAVVLIANGTGIAPFLGMIDSNLSQKEIHLFLGLRTKTSFELYSTVIENALNQGQLKTCQVAYSQEQKEKIYVQDLILKQADFIANHLKNEGEIMICGSIVMQNQVLQQLEFIVSEKLNLSLNDFEVDKKIRTDCY
jgi:sulfite reductase (NADPH) flavoprotein alpha-component